MKLLFENWRRFLNEIIINHDGKNQLYATEYSLIMLLNTIKDYKMKGYSDSSVTQTIDQHVLKKDFEKHTDLSNGYKFTIDDYNKLVKTCLMNLDKDSEEVVKLFISGGSGGLNKLSLPSSEDPEEKPDENPEEKPDIDLDKFIEPRKVRNEDLSNFPPLQSVEDNMELFSYYKSYSDEDVEKLNELGFDIAGRGADRNAFFFKDSTKYVLKVANTAPLDASGDKSEQNLRDIAIGKNPKFKDFAPQIYAYDPEGRWFVVEKTLPFKRPYTAFKKTFPELDRLSKLSSDKEVKEGFRKMPIFSLENMLGVATDNMVGNYAEKHYDAFRKLHKAALKKDITYKNFFEMIERYDIDLDDLFAPNENWKNIGIGAEDGKLKVTDPSTQGGDIEL